MQDHELEKWIAGLLGLWCLIAIYGITTICHQRDTIARQEQQIQNYKIMLLSIPVDGRDEQGRRTIK